MCACACRPLGAVQQFNGALLHSEQPGSLYHLSLSHTGHKERQEARARVSICVFVEGGRGTRKEKGSETKLHLQRAESVCVCGGLLWVKG